MIIAESYAKAIRSIFKDGGALLFCVIVPLIYPVIYTIIYNGEVAREVPVVVVDDSHSTLSRDYLRRLDGTPDVKIVGHCADMSEAQQHVMQRDCYGIIRIPSDFEKGLSTGRQVHVQAYCDMSGMLYYKGILTANTEVSLAMNAQIKVAEKGSNPIANASGIVGGTPQQKLTTQHPVQYEYVNLYNPQGGFASFLIPAVLILCVQQTMVLGIGLISGTRRERHTQVTSGHSTLLQLIGVAMAFFTVYIPICFFDFGVIPHMFGLPQLGNPWEIALITVPFLLAVFNFALVMGSISSRRENIILLAVFTTIPILFMSGVSWPGSALPTFWKYFGYLFPSTFGINAFIKLNNMGAHFDSIHFEFIALWIQYLVYAVIAWLVTTLVHKKPSKYKMANEDGGVQE